MVRFLAAELPEAIAACEEVLETAGDHLDRELLPRARVPGRRDSAGRRASQRRDLRAAARPRAGGEPRRDGGGAQPARHDGGRVRRHHRAHRGTRSAALAEAAWGDGQLLVEVRSEHPALAAPATTIALTAATIAIALAGRLSRAIEVWTAGVEEGRARSSMLLYSNSLGLRASAREWSGDLGGAEADAVAALALLPADDPIVLPSVLSALTDVHIEHGSPEQAVDAAARRLADRRAAAVAEHLPGAGVPGPARARMGDPSAALADLEEAGRRALAIVYVNPMALMWRSYAALAAARLGQRDRAGELIEEELAIARRFGAPEPIGEALRVRALLAPSGEMVELAREAVDVLAASELRVAHARALIDLGAALRRSGHRREAREPLREGLDLANRCGSVIETDRAMDELRATGARPRRPALRGVDSLSAQERRVATMATEGLSNREIAEALFLTRRTVEMHLTGAYRKLDVSGRGDLPAALAASR